MRQRTRRFSSRFVIVALAVAACAPAGPAASVPTATVPAAVPPSDPVASASQRPSDEPLVPVSGRLFLGRLAGPVEHYVTLAGGVEQELFQAEGCHPCVWPSNDGRFFGHPAPFGTDSAVIIVDTTTSTETQVPRTADGVYLGSGPWSPDDERLVRGGWHETDASKRGLWVAAVDGSGATQLTVNPEGTQHEPLAWSPVADQILYFVETNGDAPGHLGDLWRVAATGGKPRKLNPDGVLVEGFIWHGAVGSFSPDGASVAFVGFDPESGPAQRAVFVATRDAEATRITDWTPDMRSALWSPVDDRILYDGTGASGYAIRTIRGDGSDDRELANAASAGVSGSGIWSPDGTQIMFQRGEHPGADLFVMELDGSVVGRVVPTSGAWFWYRWTRG